MSDWRSKDWKKYLEIRGWTSDGTKMFPWKLWGGFRMSDEEAVQTQLDRDKYDLITDVVEIDRLENKLEHIKELVREFDFRSADQGEWDKLVDEVMT
jgi:hypothetical protein